MKKHIRTSFSEKLLQAINALLLTIIGVLTLYPFIHILFASISQSSLLFQYKGILLAPLGFSTSAYRLVLRNPNIFVGYSNTLFYVIVGTALNLVFTILGAFVLSRKYIMLRRPVLLMITFTMYFSGGIVPTFLLVKQLGLLDSRLALILPGLVSAWNLMIMTTSLAGVPDSLEESARIDGAGDWTVLTRVILPLSKPIIMVMCLYYAVGHWNSWFNAMIYLQTRARYPLQMFLREMLIQEQLQETMATQGGGTNEAAEIVQTVKYATIVVSTAPILLIYPFVQRYFVNGVMIGAIKG